MGEARARQWLDRHGATGRPTTPLLQARLDARHRSETLSWHLMAAVLAAFVVVFVVVGELSNVPRPERASLLGHGFLQLGIFYVAMALAIVAGLWLQDRDERRIARTLTRRVAHPQAVRVSTVVGRWFIVTTTVTVGAGLLAGVVAAMLATEPKDRELGLLMLAAVGAFALIGLAGLVQVVRRPAIADDEQSLGDDLLLRREDALRVATPYPAVLAAVAAVHSRSLTVLFVFLGYALAAVIVSFLAHWAVSRAPAARPVSSSSGAAA
jgi:hypothetical protein